MYVRVLQNLRVPQIDVIVYSTVNGQLFIPLINDNIIVALAKCTTLDIFCGFFINLINVGVNHYTVDIKSSIYLCLRQTFRSCLTLNDD